MNVLGFRANGFEVTNFITVGILPFEFILAVWAIKKPKGPVV